MSRLIGIVFIVLLIWVGIEVYTKGIDGAFGGIIAEATDAPATRSTPNRALDAFQRAYDKSEERVNQQLDPDHGED